MSVIDAHQHFWNPARGDYGWMPMDNSILARLYSIADLSPELMANEVERTVLIQAAPTVHETEYMLGIADSTDRVAAVVGWINFEDSNDREILSRLAAHPKFAGVRPMIQDIPDEHWMLREDIRWAFQAIIEEDLTFDALGFPCHLENFCTLLNMHPDLRAVINHCMKPSIAQHSQETFTEWKKGISRIAKETNAYCKLSGLVTEAPADWRISQLRPYAETVVEMFGANRIMWGSDWPVCRLRAEYSEWLEAAITLLKELSDDEQSMIFGKTATEFYRLDEACS